MQRARIQQIAGLGTVAAVAAVVAVCVGLFRGTFTDSIPVTVISSRAGLVMNPDAKVKFHGVQIGRVKSIEVLPDGQAALHLGIDPAQLSLLPSNVRVDIASSTVFGAKFVQLSSPTNPSADIVHPGQVLQGEHVTVELNTVFQQLSDVLRTIEPAKLNETLGAMSKAFNGRGERIGQSLADFEQLLAKLEPSLPSLSHTLETLPAVITSYADAAPDLLASADNASRISRSVVDTQDDLDALLVSATGLADIGNDVLSTNRAPLTDVLDLLVPTTDLLNQYHRTLNCSIAGLIPLATTPPLAEPGIVVSAGLTMGIERYRYPSNLPKVAATGDPTCLGLPRVPPATSAPFLVADVGANPWQYGNQGIVLNSDGLKQLLFGPIDGPPRNTAQIGQPG